MTKSSIKNLDDGKHFQDAIRSKDRDTAQLLLMSLLAGDQMLLPGFSTEARGIDDDIERGVKRIIGEVVKELNIPYALFQTAYGRCPDFRRITDALTSQNPMRSLEKIEPEIFLPIRPFRALRIDNPEIAWDSSNGGDWVVQQKLDGWYCQIHTQNGKTILFSRKGENFTFAPTISSLISKSFGMDKVILECELVGIEPGGTISARNEMKNPSNYIRGYCFDLLYYNGDWTRKPYVERLSGLKTLISNISNIDPKLLRVVDGVGVNTKENFVAYFDKWNGLNGLEGMIAKRPNSIYESDCANKEFLKIKVKDTLDAIIMGFIGNPRSYLVGILDEFENDFVPFAWISSSSDQTDIISQEVSSHIIDLPPIFVGGRKTEFRTDFSLVVEVEGDKIFPTDKFPCGKRQTGTGWSIFEPRIAQIRSDKGSNDATTVDSFLKLHRMAGYNKR